MTKFWPLITSLILIALLVAETGCEGHTVFIGGDKPVWILGATLLDNKGIESAKITGFGEIKGFSANPNIEALRAATEGAAAGVAKIMAPSMPPLPAFPTTPLMPTVPTTPPPAIGTPPVGPQ